MFEYTDGVISDPIRFKIKLAIGEDAYTSLRLKSRVVEAWDMLGIAGTAATVAKSSIVASTFFAPSGLLALVGIGTAATPIGWVVAASVVSAGAWAGVSRYLNNQSKNKVTVIPNFINTPLDVLALGLFDLMAPLALKVANADEEFDEIEKSFITRYFIKEWGYHEKFIVDAISLTQNNLSNFSVEDVAQRLAKFQRDNPDCNYKEMTREIICFLDGIMESNGSVHKAEELEIAKIESILNESGLYKQFKSIKEKTIKSSQHFKNTITNAIWSYKK